MMPIVIRRVKQNLAGQGVNAMGLDAQLRTAIEESGQGQREISRGSGVSQAAISRFLKGERSLTLESASKIFDYLGVRLTPEKPKKKR